MDWRAGIGVEGRTEKMCNFHSIEFKVIILDISSSGSFVRCA